jgi:hypothetical protein
VSPPERKFECGTDPVPAGAVGILEQAPYSVRGVRLEDILAATTTLARTELDARHQALLARPPGHDHRH